MNLDKDTLASLMQGDAIAKAEQAISAACNPAAAAGGVVALPNNFQTHDFEKYLQFRRRVRGVMATSQITSFGAYVTANDEQDGGAYVFIDPDKMTASAVMNLGTPDLPGHADNICQLTLRPTAAYRSLLAMTEGQKTQQQMVEFLEDWGPSCMQAFNGDVQMDIKYAISALRTVTIESLRRSESTEGQLQASRSSLDQVKATSGANPLPTALEFRCEPYVGLDARTFRMRVAIFLGEKSPSIGLRIVKAAEHLDEMAQELAQKVTEQISPDGEDAGIRVLIGTYSRGA